MDLDLTVFLCWIFEERCEVAVKLLYIEKEKRKSCDGGEMGCWLFLSWLNLAFPAGLKEMRTVQVCQVLQGPIEITLYRQNDEWMPHLFHGVSAEIELSVRYVNRASFGQMTVEWHGNRTLTCCKQCSRPGRLNRRSTFTC